MRLLRPPAPRDLPIILAIAVDMRAGRLNVTLLHTARLLSMLSGDLRYAVRTLRKSPVFTAAAVLTMALTIGANTAIFSVVNAVLIRPLPFASPNQLMQVAEKNDKLQLSSFAASVLNYLSWKEQQHSFENLAAMPWPDGAESSSLPSLG